MTDHAEDVRVYSSQMDCATSKEKIINEVVTFQNFCVDNI